MARKLDRSRGFAEVHGPGVGYAYEQDGLCFDHAGVEIGGEALEVAEAVAQETLVTEEASVNAPAKPKAKPGPKPKAAPARSAPAARGPVFES